MIWDSWISDPEVLTLERELNRLGTIVVKLNDHVQIGSFSRTKIFDAETFKRMASEISRTRNGGNPDARGQRSRGRSSRNHSSPLESGVTQAEVENAIAALSRLAMEALSERDEWRARALDAETRLGSSRTPSSQMWSDNIEKIKRQFAIALHPDAATSEAEKALRSELFKQVWPLVEQLEETVAR